MGEEGNGGETKNLPCASCTDAVIEMHVFRKKNAWASLPDGPVVRCFSAGEQPDVTTVALNEGERVRPFAVPPRVSLMKHVRSYREKIAFNGLIGSSGKRRTSLCAADARLGLGGGRGDGHFFERVYNPC